MGCYGSINSTNDPGVQEVSPGTWLDNGELWRGRCSTAALTIEFAIIGSTFLIFIPKNRY